MCITPLSGQAQPFDVFIAENPLALRVYNRYQQNLTPGESRLLRPYAPMRITDEAAFLSDNFTRCMIVEIDRATFYIIKDDDNTPVNAGQAGFNRIFRNCTAVGDTVEALSDRAITLWLGEPGSARTAPMEKGKRLHRLFRHNRVDYVRTLQNPAVYGWGVFSSGTRGRAWNIYKRRVNAAAMPSDLQRRIQGRIREVNEVFEELFTRLNQESAQNRTIPKWRIERDEARMICTLNEPAYADLFSETTQYLVNDIANILIGANFEVAHQDGVITVQPRRR